MKERAERTYKKLGVHSRVVGSPFATGGTGPFGVAVGPDGSRV